MFDWADAESGWGFVLSRFRNFTYCSNTRKVLESDEQNANRKQSITSKCHTKFNMDWFKTHFIVTTTGRSKRSGCTFWVVLSFSGLRAPTWWTILCFWIVEVLSFDIKAKYPPRILFESLSFSFSYTSPVYICISRPQWLHRCRGAAQCLATALRLHVISKDSDVYLQGKTTMKRLSLSPLHGSYPIHQILEWRCWLDGFLGESGTRLSGGNE